MSVRDEYAARYGNVLTTLAASLQGHIARYFEEVPRIDRISARAKSIDRFVDKAEKVDDRGRPKYADPLSEIQDQVGARIITIYLDDINPISEVVERYFRPVERKNLVPESDWKFGYFGKHYVLFIPSDVLNPTWKKEQVPNFFELQIKTLFQHAWSEANHDLGYKPGLRELSGDELRQLAFTSAQAWGADKIFSELFRSRE